MVGIPFKFLKISWNPLNSLKSWKSSLESHQSPSKSKKYVMRAPHDGALMTEKTETSHAITRAPSCGALMTSWGLQSWCIWSHGNSVIQGVAEALHVLHRHATRNHFLQPKENISCNNKSNLASRNYHKTLFPVTRNYFLSQKIIVFCLKLKVINSEKIIHFFLTLP